MDDSRKRDRRARDSSGQGFLRVPSYAFVGQQRFFRILKEQVTHGRVFQILEDVRDAVRAFIADTAPSG